MIGSYQDGLDANALHGDVAEMLIYNKALTTTERSAIESYLNEKWGL